MDISNNMKDPCPTNNENLTPAQRPYRYSFWDLYYRNCFDMHFRNKYMSTSLFCQGESQSPQEQLCREARTVSTTGVFVKLPWENTRFIPANCKTDSVQDIILRIREKGISDHKLYFSYGPKILNQNPSLCLWQFGIHNLSTIEAKSRLNGGMFNWRKKKKKKMNTAAIHIQSAFQRYRQRKASIKQAQNERKLFLMKKAASITIQRQLQTFFERKNTFSQAQNERKLFLEQKAASVVIQNQLQIYLMRRANYPRAQSERKLFLQKKTAAVTIQSQQRMRAKRAAFLNILNAIINVQGLFRMNAARKSLQTDLRCQSEIMMSYYKSEDNILRLIAVEWAAKRIVGAFKNSTALFILADLFMALPSQHDFHEYKSRGYDSTWDYDETSLSCGQIQTLKDVFGVCKQNYDCEDLSQETKRAFRAVSKNDGWGEIPIEKQFTLFHAYFDILRKNLRDDGGHRIELFLVYIVGLLKDKSKYLMKEAANLGSPSAMYVIVHRQMICDSVFHMKAETKSDRDSISILKYCAEGGHLHAAISLANICTDERERFEYKSVWFQNLARRISASGLAPGRNNKTCRINVIGLPGIILNISISQQTALYHLRKFANIQQDFREFVAFCTGHSILDEFKIYAEKMIKIIALRQAEFLNKAVEDFRDNYGNQKKSKSNLLPIFDCLVHFFKKVQFSLIKRKNQANLLLQTVKIFKQLSFCVKIAHEHDLKSLTSQQSPCIKVPFCLDCADDIAWVTNNLYKPNNTIQRVKNTNHLEDKEGKQKKKGKKKKKATKFFSCIGRSETSSDDETEEVCATKQQKKVEDEVLKHQTKSYTESLKKTIRWVEKLRQTSGKLASVTLLEDEEKKYPEIPDGGYTVTPKSTRQWASKSKGAQLRVHFERGKLASICVVEPGNSFKDKERLQFQLYGHTFLVQANSLNKELTLIKVKTENLEHTSLKYKTIQAFHSIGIQRENISFHDDKKKKTKILTWSVSEKIAKLARGYIITYDEALAGEVFQGKTVDISIPPPSCIHVENNGQTELSYDLESCLEERKFYKFSISMYRSHGLPSERKWLTVFETCPRSDCPTYMKDNYCNLVQSEDGELPRYQLKVDEITEHLCTRDGKDPKKDCDCIKVFQFNKQRRTPIVVPKRYLLLVGQTGDGKTTALKALLNHYYGIDADHSFRLDVPVDTTSTTYLNGKTGQSDTVHVRVFVLWPLEDSPVQYPLVIIDTPGFGDTRGMAQDKINFQEIAFVLGDKESKGKDKLPVRLKSDKETHTTYVAGLEDGELHGVVLVMKSNVTRLTERHNYIKERTLELFGKNVSDILLVKTTFHDGNKLQTRDALKEDATFKDIGEDRIFSVNNGVLFTNQIHPQKAQEESLEVQRKIKHHEDEMKSYDGKGESEKMIRRIEKIKEELETFKDEKKAIEKRVRFAQNNINNWTDNHENYERFFEWIKGSRGITLLKTRKTLSARRDLQFVCDQLHAEIQKHHSTLMNIRKLLDEIDQLDFSCQKLIEERKILVGASELVAVKHNDGRAVTVCATCRYTCHTNCQIHDNKQKKHCFAMGEGRHKEHAKCSACPGKCHWSDHYNTAYMYIEKQTVIEKTMKEVAKDYKVALDSTNAKQELLMGLVEQFGVVHHVLCKCYNDIHKILLKLDEYALRTGRPSDMVSYIEDTIKMELAAQTEGWEEKVRHLELMKDNYAILESAFEMKKPKNRKKLGEWKNGFKLELRRRILEKDNMDSGNSMFKSYIDGLMEIINYKKKSTEKPKVKPKTEEEIEALAKRKIIQIENGGGKSKSSAQP
jgi:hypothetical protein